MNSRLLSLALTPCIACVLSTPALTQGTWRVSLDSSAGEGNGLSTIASISGNGRFVAFTSDATDLVASDTNGVRDAFVRDRQTGITTRVSVDSAGMEANGASTSASISEDGRFVAFMSAASNLVIGDSNGFQDAFVHDRQTGTTTRISVDSAGVEGNGDSYEPELTSDGQLVVFSSDASNLVVGDANAEQDVFVHDLQTATTTRVSVDSAGGEGDRFSTWASISGDGRIVAFVSLATNLVGGDANGSADVFVHNRNTGTTRLVSRDSAGGQGDRGSFNPCLSRHGRYVAFHSFATNLVTGDSNGVGDVFVHDRQTGTTTRVSLDSSGAEGDGTSLSPSISGDGRFVSFWTRATDLVPGDTNAADDVLVHDRQTGLTTLASASAAGVLGDAGSYGSLISADGRFVVYYSDATNLVSGDSNGLQDVFVHGPDLTLEASPLAVLTGDTLTLTAWTGKPAGLTMLAVVDITGTPMFVKVTQGKFDGSGLWTMSGAVPPGLAGNVVTFLSLGVAPTGKVGLTNQEAVTFQ